jgi:heat shock protein HtpX
LSIVIRFALSRSREFLADAGSVELTKNPDAMISALRKIEGRGELEGATSAVMEMCVDNPREGFADLFATHPSIESRVDALVKHAGGRDPGPITFAAPGDDTQGEVQAETSVPQVGPDTPFLPEKPPLDLDAKPPAPGADRGPWGPQRQS